MKRVLILSALALLAGCGSYSWRSKIPADMRTVAVPTFRNESGVAALGSATTRQTLREFQREGTFAVRPAGDAALEIQGVIKSAKSVGLDYDRASYLRNSERRLTATAEVSLIDKRGGRVIFDSRVYEAEITFLSADDELTAERDASGRLAEEFARQIVDDVLDLDMKGAEAK